MAVSHLLKSRASAVSTFRAHGPRRTRQAVRPRAEPSDNTTSVSTPNSGTIFYAGRSFTPAEWEEALSKGTVGTPSPATGIAANAVTNPVLDNFVEAMAFSGPAPEIINGRLAMLGFVTAAAAELSSGEGVLKQWSEAQTPIALTFLLFIVASLVPIFRGSQQTSMGPFTASAEMLNGRLAMLGFASLIVVEAVKGSAVL